MKQILNERGTIIFNNKSWEYLNLEITNLAPSKVFVLVDDHTKKHCFSYLLTNLKLKPIVIEIVHGEDYKNISVCQKIWLKLAENGADRNSLLLNLGGGVITDLGGFVAATFKRGIEFIHIPTTLLSMIDAAVGGKNGVNLGVLKNQIGVIKKPKLTLIDGFFLKTLPNDEFNSGFAEMLKHGIIHSKSYFDKLTHYSISNQQQLEPLIWESVVIKNTIVEKDPFEKGLRKTLNFGHTLGHAIESFFMDDPKKKLLHGEAVAIGMILTCFISTKIMYLPKETCDYIAYAIYSKYKKVEFSKKDIENILKLLVFDKKNRNGKVLFVLLKDFGNCEINCEVPNNFIFEAFEYYKNL